MIRLAAAATAILALMVGSVSAQIAELSRLFPDESFSLGCVAAGARAANFVACLLAAFAALLGIILVRSIA